MILAWVISLLLLCASLVVHLERLTALRIVEFKTLEITQQNFIAAEKAVSDCENHFTTLSLLSDNPCFIQPISKTIWLITSKQKPAIQVHIAFDEKSGKATRINWRQVFE
ncbi:hypothetical protein [Polynucleobacter sp. UB-Raua-W9]|uniref:hypothetical protein n=1 Tax=Polynucleobacter sp. UB-Raua-W9 TaxID=1819736 RepID=UPI001BFDB33A|nr:hypothetical protein [Polynucleobacter sp. UB-Raua-W9]QWD72672.1 hypothetical protein AOC07_01415 [Polynucleobacter sp. UB-Raua-W9]